MNDIILAQNNELTMSSREIAKLTGKNHSHVFRDARKMLDDLEESHQEYIQIWTHPQNKQSYEEYALPKELTITLISGYNLKMRHSITKRWIELEAKQQFQIPQTLGEALQLAADQAKQLELQAPKVEYFNKVLETTNGFTTTEIASELKMSAIKLNKTLKEMTIQRKIGGRWVLTASNLGNGYTTERTHVDDGGNSRHSMLWTEKGRMFILDLFKL